MSSCEALRDEKKKKNIYVYICKNNITGLQDGEPNVVQAVEQAVPLEVVHSTGEAHALTVAADHSFSFEVHLEDKTNK